MNTATSPSLPPAMQFVPLAEVVSYLDEMRAEIRQLKDILSQERSPEDVQMMTEEAMAYCRISSKEGWQRFRERHGIDHARTGKGNMFWKSALDAALKNK